MKHFFEAAERYSDQQKIRGKNSLGSASYAVSICGNDNNFNKPFVVNPFVFCTLCYKPSVKSNHSIVKCSKYRTAVDKLTRIKEIKACLKCANLEHTVDECKFRFNTKWSHFSG